MNDKLKELLVKLKDLLEEYDAEIEVISSDSADVRIKNQGVICEAHFCDFISPSEINGVLNAKES